jgi:SAM-dependent methyltransferase
MYSLLVSPSTLASRLSAAASGLLPGGSRRWGFLRRALGVTRPVARVAELWGDAGSAWRCGGESHWAELTRVQRRINRRVSGDPAIDPYLYFIQTRLSLPIRLERVLTLGCGFGEFERGLVQYGTIERHDAVDIAAKAVQKAQELAKEAGLSHLHYEVSDLNERTFETRAYDCVFGVHAVHHVERLEHLFGQVRRALKPGGWFVLNEFVGPSRFQWTDRQLEVINCLLLALPERFRRESVHGGRIKEPVVRPTIAQMRAMDPSEAARSAEIVPLAQRFFDVVDLRGYGGTLLHPLLHEIAGNFKDEVPGGGALLEAICDFEEALIAAGDLTDDFALIVARKP